LVSSFVRFLSFAEGYSRRHFPPEGLNGIFDGHEPNFFGATAKIVTFSALDPLYFFSSPELFKAQSSSSDLRAEASPDFFNSKIERGSYLFPKVYSPFSVHLSDSTPRLLVLFL